MLLRTANYNDYKAVVNAFRSRPVMCAHDAPGDFAAWAFIADGSFVAMFAATAKPAAFDDDFPNVVVLAGGLTF
jgi:hypothetical protein